MKTTPMTRQDNEVRPYTKGDFSFMFDETTCLVCVESQTDDAESVCVSFGEGFDGNHTEPTYKKSVDGWTVTKGVLKESK